MNRPTQYTATPRHSQWIDLSEQHKNVRERLETALANFADGQGASVPSIVGAYGSGKSELMAWGFRYCWRELRIPAFILNAESLIRQLPETMSPAQFADAVGVFVQDHMIRLGEHLETGSLPDGICLSTDMRPSESPLSYLRELFEDWTLSTEVINSILNKGRGVLFIDEIEQQYSALLERVEANDRAPLREMLQRLGNGQESYYVVLSFGLTSAYEAIGGADARRMDTLTLPIPEPTTLGKYIKLDGYENFIWWTSRGRPGWAVKLSNDWGSGLAAVHALEHFTDLQPRTIENLPLIDVSSLPDALRSQRVNELITQLLKALQPVPWSELQFSSDHRKDDALPRKLVLIVRSEEELTPLAELIDDFLDDLISLAARLDLPISDLAQLRRYLTRAYSAMADKEGRVVFGGPRKPELLAQGVIAPILILTQDLLLEFEGDQESTLGVLNLLDRVMNHVGVVGDQVRDDFDLLREFPRIEERFIETRDRIETSWVSLSPKAVESLFPRLVGRPLLRLVSGTKPTLDEQRAGLEAGVKNGSPRLYAKVTHETTTVEFVFVPSASCLRTIQGSYFSRNHRHHYLAADKLFVLVDLADEDGFHVTREVNGDDIGIMERIHKLQTVPLPEKRLKDFLASLWHNFLQVDLDDEESVSLVDALEAVRSHAKLTKSDRRKLEYYEHRLKQTLQSIAIASVRAYQGQRLNIFSPGESGFPRKRIADALGGIRESRTIEQIGLALDLTTEYDATVNVLADLRGLEHLRKLTKQPNAYSEFLENYTVTTRPIESGASLKDIYEYVKRKNRFDNLRDIAERLGLQPPSHFESATDAVADAPMLLLYSNLTSEEKVLIKALSFYAYIESNQSEYVQLLDELTNDTDSIQGRLEALGKDIDSFNEELDYDLLDSSEVNTFRVEVRKLTEVLGGREQFSPMLTYVVYRFVESATEALRDKRQRWASEHGLEGWRQKLRDLRNWGKIVTGLEEEVDALFVENPDLKANILGMPRGIVEKLGRQLKDGAAQVFDSLQTGNPLDTVDKSNISVDAYTKARNDIRAGLDQLVDQANAIDHLVYEINEIQSNIDRVIGKLGSAQDE